MEWYIILEDFGNELIAYTDDKQLAKFVAFELSIPTIVETFQGKMDELFEYVHQKCGIELDSGYKLKVVETQSLCKRYAIATNHMIDQEAYDTGAADTATYILANAFCNLHIMTKYIQDPMVRQMLEYLFYQYIGYLVAFTSGTQFREVSNINSIYDEGIKFDILYILIKDQLIIELPPMLRM